MDSSNLGEESPTNLNHTLCFYVLSQQFVGNTTRCKLTVSILHKVTFILQKQTTANRKIFVLQIFMLYFFVLRLRYLRECSKINNHDKIHFTTKHICCAHMLASYLTAVQISRLLKPHAQFVNRLRTLSTIS